MWREEINIRDPYVLVHNGMYYLYGTRAETTWGKADGFDCYRSRDLKEWEGPFEIFHRPEGFWADQEYWAPECVRLADAFYLVTTFGAEDRKKGIYVLRAEEPEGPFVPYGERLTPEDWACIDGTVYFEGETPYLVFSHSFEDTPDGDMCCVKRTTCHMPREMWSGCFLRWRRRGRSRCRLLRRNSAWTAMCISRTDRI